LTALLVTGPASGTMALNANGAFTYTPNANFNGTDSFTYRANDGTTNSGPATVTITVVPVNDAPVANPDSYTTNEDTALTVAAPGVLANDTDVDGNALTAALVTGPASGTLALNANGAFTYTPNANFNGTDSFTYRANDGTTTSGPATVTITVVPVNDAPVANPDSYTTNEDTALTVAAPGVLANDTDVDGNALTAALVTGPASGTLTLNTNGAFTYTPNANFNGTDSFTYRANDGTTTSGPATVTITVVPVNDAPVANADSYTTNQDAALTVAAPGVLANDTDVDGNTLTAALVTGPASGQLTLNANGSFTYTPNAGFNGTDTFVYRASDGTTVSNPVAVTITVVPPTEELSTISGLVYEDGNNNGSVDFGEHAISGVTLHLTGVNDLGAAVNLTTTTDGQGVYMFAGLRRGSYAVSEDQPTNYTDGIDSVGTVNGVTTGSNAVNDTLSGIVISQSGSVAQNYNFGETSAGQPLHAGQAATVGYWQNSNGQALLRSLNGGPNSTALGNWLATNFSNIWGANAGANNLAGKTNAQVADFYSQVFTRTRKQMTQLGIGGPVAMDAQLMAVAFAVYVTDSDLAGTTATSYGFVVDSFGAGARTVNVGTNGAAFDVADGTQATILNLLLAANNHAYHGILYDMDHDGDSTSSLEVTLRTMANVVFTAINQTGDIV